MTLTLILSTLSIVALAGLLWHYARGIHQLQAEVWAVRRRTLFVEQRLHRQGLVEIPHVAQMDALKAEGPAEWRRLMRQKALALGELHDEARTLPCPDTGVDDPTCPICRERVNARR